MHKCGICPTGRQTKVWFRMAACCSFVRLSVCLYRRAKDLRCTLFRFGENRSHFDCETVKYLWVDCTAYYLKCWPSSLALSNVKVLNVPPFLFQQGLSPFTTLCVSRPFLLFWRLSVKGSILHVFGFSLVPKEQLISCHQGQVMSLRQRIRELVTGKK